MQTEAENRQEIEFIIQVKVADKQNSVNCTQMLSKLHKNTLKRTGRYRDTHSLYAIYRDKSQGALHVKLATRE